MSYSHTVVGIFDSDFDAQDAVDELISNGFYRQDIEVNNRRNVNASETYGTDSEARHQGHTDSNDSAITRFFKSIFGDDSDDADKHSRLAIEGGAVVTVHTNSVEQAARASDILDRKGAVDVDDRSSKYGKQAGVGSKLETDASTSPAMNADQPYSSGSGSPNDAEINNLDTQTDEDPNPRQRREEYSGPGVGSNPTSGNRSKSRVLEWRGEASARLRDDRDSETKIGW